MTIVSLILDVVIIGLLIATIIYAINLSRHLGRLRNSRAELETLIRGFNEAIARADIGVKGMKKAAAETGDGLQRNIDRAQKLRDELQLIVETGEALANRLDIAVSRKGSGPAVDAGAARAPAREARTPVAPEEPPARTPESPPRRPPASDDRNGLSRAERELLEAMETRR